jgi:hypothetical protein
VSDRGKGNPGMVGEGERMGLSEGEGARKESGGVGRGIWVVVCDKPLVGVEEGSEVEGMSGEDMI